MSTGFTLSQLRAFAREHNSKFNIRVSQKKTNLLDHLHKQGVTMPKNQVYKGFVPKPSGKIKNKKAVKTANKKKKRALLSRTEVICWCHSPICLCDYLMRVSTYVRDQFHDHIIQSEYQLF